MPDRLAMLQYRFCVINTERIIGDYLYFNTCFGQFAIFCFRHVRNSMRSFCESNSEMPIVTFSVIFSLRLQNFINANGNFLLDEAISKYALSSFNNNSNTLLVL